MLELMNECFKNVLVTHLSGSVKYKEKKIEDERVFYVVDNQLGGKMGEFLVDFFLLDNFHQEFPQNPPPVENQQVTED